MCYAVLSNNDDEFEKWQKEVQEAEAEVEAEVEVEAEAEAGAPTGLADGTERPMTPPDGEDEFIDDDGTRYKWDRSIRAWVPQVCFQTDLLVVSC